jgi:hypothetical protein
MVRDNLLEFIILFTISGGGYGTFFGTNNA